jgi:hypothetical protein
MLLLVQVTYVHFTDFNQYRRIGNIMIVENNLHHRKTVASYIRWTLSQTDKGRGYMIRKKVVKLKIKFD